MAQDPLGLSSTHDGLQVAGGDDREEKYPAVLTDAPKVPIATDDNALCLTSIEGTQKEPIPTHALTGDVKPARPGTRLRKRNVCIMLAVASSILIGACVGGVLGSRRARSTPTSHPISTRTSAAPTASSTLLFQDGDRDKVQSNTSFAAATYPYLADYNYVVFYQHANGDIRKCVYNGTGWHKPTYVTNDARMGTGLTTAWTEAASGPLLWLYYIDKANRLQEMRGTHASDNWTRGTLGNNNFEATTKYSALSVQIMGDCHTGRNAWLFYQTSDGAIRQVWWNSVEDKWSTGTNFTEAEPQTGFVTFLSSSTVWRFFMMSTHSRVVQYICIDCCDRVEWKQSVGYEFRNDAGPSNGIGTINHGGRLLRYQSSDGLIRTLNNSGDPGNESFESSPLIIGKAKLGTMMALADGSPFRQPVKAFYQANGSDVTVTSWNPDALHLRTTEQLPLTL